MLQQYVAKHDAMAAELKACKAQAAAAASAPQSGQDDEEVDEAEGGEGTDPVDFLRARRQPAVAGAGAAAGSVASGVGVAEEGEPPPPSTAAAAAMSTPTQQQVEEQQQERTPAKKKAKKKKKLKKKPKKKAAGAAAPATGTKRPAAAAAATPAAAAAAAAGGGGLPGSLALALLQGGMHLQGGDYNGQHAVALAEQELTRGRATLQQQQFLHGQVVADAHRRLAEARRDLGTARDALEKQRLGWVSTTISIMLSDLTRYSYTLTLIHSLLPLLLLCPAVPCYCCCVLLCPATAAVSCCVLPSCTTLHGCKRNAPG